MLKVAFNMSILFFPRGLWEALVGLDVKRSMLLLTSRREGTWAFGEGAASAVPVDPSSTI